MSNQAYNKASVMDVFVRKPVIAIVLSIVICLAGLAAIMKIPVIQFPQMESSSLTIATYYTGASADVVKGFITEPVERVAATIPGVDYVDSKTTAGSSTVTAWLKLNQDSTRALAELNTKLSQISYELPADAQDPIVSVVRADRAYAAFYLNVNFGERDSSQVSDYLNREVIPLLTSVEGVQKVQLEGGRIPAMRINIDSDRLAAFNLSTDDIYQALRNNNAIATLGYSQNDRQRIDIITNSQLSNSDEFENLVIKKIDGDIIYLKDVATVALGSEEPSVTARVNIRDTIYVSVWPLPGANEIDIGDNLYLAVDEINKAMPDGMDMEFAYDGTLYMRDALTEIITTLIETVVIVGLVVLMLMGSFRTAMVPLVTIPISILGAIAAMSLMGFSLNLLTVLAIVLSVGLVVDDAIVVVENVARYMREGMGRRQAALLSSRQLLVPIISMTLTLAAVYSPIGFLAGLTGMLFKEFAFSLAIAVVISGVVAITLSPIMSASVCPKGGQEGWLTRKVNHGFSYIQSFYGKALERIFALKYQVTLMAVVISILAVPFYLQSAKELAPIEDQSSVIVIVQSPPQSSLAYNEAATLEMTKGLLSIENAQEMWQVIFPTGGFGGITFAKPHERDFHIDAMVPQVYMNLVQNSGLDSLPILPPSLPTAGQFDVEVVLKSSQDYQEMKLYADKLVQAAFASGQFLFADSELKIDLPQLELLLDRDKLADLNLTVNDVNQQLSVYLSSNFVNRFDSNGKAYQVIPMVNDQVRGVPENILNLTVKTPTGGFIPISSFASLEWRTGPRQLTTFGQQNSVKIYGGVLPGVTKEKALATIEQAAQDILPSSYRLDYAGESRQIRNEGNTLMTVLAISLVIVFLILAVQFNSFRDPLVVLLGCVPLALSGALLLPFIELTTINIYSQIGLVTLVGLIAKNGILIVEFANHVQEQGKNKLEAVKAAATTRLRPILMTTGATVFGHFPLVLVTGAGAEARNSIGIILVAGMLIGTFFTLVVLPIFYLWFAENRSKAKHEDLDFAKSFI
ncbi:efflux RND transporter permease subunit [Thalassotalea sp. HSM 43]|uniref:efflux RND transporter permease subunit n=1 Tax=Thalassotalea sp. HSM 43 TaxID=2552945 RepID=UPI00108143F7|nr:efflux RND transporter permease subunit [Thalassotalea sp. HSM 43]QBY03665.1 efflux RND transporter permease subunit [Thalassotalea sp. HSM 43]